MSEKVCGTCKWWQEMLSERCEPAGSGKSDLFRRCISEKFFYGSGWDSENGIPYYEPDHEQGYERRAFNDDMVLIEQADDEWDEVGYGAFFGRNFGCVHWEGKAVNEKERYDLLYAG